MRVLQELSQAVECKTCGRLLAIEKGDIALDDCGALHHHPGFDAWVNCCSCGNLIPLKTSELPRRWIAELEGTL